ncbi:hypothetical protein ACWY4P_15680 [Streptomyces sp. LZ34]
MDRKDDTQPERPPEDDPGIGALEGDLQLVIDAAKKKLAKAAKDRQARALGAVETTEELIRIQIHREVRLVESVIVTRADRHAEFAKPVSQSRELCRRVVLIEGEIRGAPLRESASAHAPYGGLSVDLDDRRGLVLGLIGMRPVADPALAAFGNHMQVPAELLGGDEDGPPTGVVAFSVAEETVITSGST